ncbi:MAG: hypothetical protein GF353_06495 [Candidatus Lokiarchaeota archaeon]|nr:hypothetical protein [Candidatus Lokiarchaeota archaeon]
MKLKNKLIPAIDLMLLIIIMLLIGLFAIRYDANKGLDENKFIPLKIVHPAKTGEETSFNDFTAIIIMDDHLIIKEFKNQTNIYEKSVEIENFPNFIQAEKNYVIYGYHESEHLFSKTINALINNDVSFWIAK